MDAVKILNLTNTLKKKVKPKIFEGDKFESEVRFEKPCNSNSRLYKLLNESWSADG